MGAAWSSLVSAMIELGQAGVDVIVDAGRLGPEALPSSLVSRASLIGIVTGSRLRQLAGLSMRAEEVEAMSSATTGTVGLVVVGPGRPYNSREIGHQFGLPVFGDIVFDAHAAAVLSDGEPAGKRWYVTSMQSMAESMRERICRADQAITGPEILSTSAMGVAS